MPFVVLGINHRTAPVEVREQVVFTDAELPAALKDLSTVPQVREAVIVSTCNRTELYCYAEDENVPLARWLEHWHKPGLSDIHECMYRHVGRGAVAHAFAVASGLDSMILGEPQILGQLKDAYRTAQQEAVLGPYLNRLFQAAFAAAKHVRTHTRIGANAVSVASAAVSLAHTVFEHLEERTALLVGAGETIALAARHLSANGVRRMIVANRSLENAQVLALEFNAYATTLDGLATHLAEADIVVASTASPTPVITLAAVKAALRARKRRPMFMVDIAVPRDIEPEVGDLEDIYLFTLDDLNNVVNENLAARHEAAAGADELIAEQVRQFELQLRSLDAVPAIRHLREEAAAVRMQTLEQAQRLLASGRAPAEVLEFLATTLTNRLTHMPSQRLRIAAERGEAELIRAARELFGADDPETDKE